MIGISYFKSLTKLHKIHYISNRFIDYLLYPKTISTFAAANQRTKVVIW